MQRKHLFRLALPLLVLGLLCSLSGCNMMPMVTKQDVLDDLLPDYPPYCVFEVGEIETSWEDQYAIAHCTKYTNYAAYYSVVDVNARYGISRKSKGWQLEHALNDNDTFQAVISVDLSGSYSCDGFSFELESTDDPNVYTLYGNVAPDGSYIQTDITFQYRSDSWFFNESDDFWMEASDYLDGNYLTLSLSNDELLIEGPVYGVLASGLDGDLPIDTWDSNVGVGTSESY